MKCPYCNKEMWHPIGKPTWSCQNWDCMKSEGMIGNHVLWQALIDTKKKLDIAVKRLKDIVLDAEILATPEYLASRAKETFEQINNKEEK